MVGTFVLVMGITAATGLAIYALGTSNNVIRQITAIGLAREGVEAVKNIRDTNWLKGSLSSTCHNFTDGTSTGQCYPSWLSGAAVGGYDIDPGGSVRSYRLVFRLNPSGPHWQLQPDTANWGLNLDTATTSPAFSGFYSVPPLSFATGLADGTSKYYRKITLSTDTAPPYDQSTGPRLRIVSQVWWSDDKKCPRVQDWPGTGRCSVQLTTFLTNWKDYQP